VSVRPSKNSVNTRLAASRSGARNEAGEPAIGLKRGERSFVNASLNENALKLL
jgi:hypothetical protein